jgi:ADP-ribosylglycohydrolase
MRTHPLGVMCVGFDLEKTFWIAADISRTTHVDPRCVLACCVSTVLIRGMLRGEVMKEADVDVLMQQAYEWVAAQNILRNPGLEKELSTEVDKNLLNAEEFKRHINAQNFQELELDDSQEMGYVYKCLGSAILTLRLAIRATHPTPHTFENLITDLIMRGGDADTNAAVAGALLGTWLGFSRLPANWSEGIKHREWLMEKTQALSCLAGVSERVFETEMKDDANTGIYGGKKPMTEEEVKKMERDLLVMILEKQKERKKDEKRMEPRKKGLGRWLKGSQTQISSEVLIGS